MNRRTILILLLSLMASTTRAQVTGSDTVCAGYIYTFDATVAGADSFVWTFPNGWAQISGTTTSHVEGLCTQNDGQVCVDAYDTAGQFIGQYCHAVHWGNGGSGWYIQLGTLGFCQCPPNSATVVPNGAGGNCAGCGNGVLSPNLRYTIFDNPWPIGQFYWYADGSAFASPLVPTTFYVYLVDWTFTTPILIEGGLCPGSIQNTFFLSDCQYVNLGIDATPDPVCIGDTVTLAYDGLYGYYSSMSWSFFQGNATILSTNGNDTAYAIVNAPGQTMVNVLAFDANNCPYSGSLLINTSLCNAALTGDSVVCAGYTYNYTASIPGAVSYTWTFPNGWYDINGQGSSSVSATCNVSDGNICVEGFDANAVSVGTECIITQWGGGGSAGWDIFPDGFYYCDGQPRDVLFLLVPNGSTSGACPSGCGNGGQHANIVYGIYDNAFPNNHLIGIIDSTFISMPAITTTYYIYMVDITNGNDFPSAVMISGGCAGASINNTVTTWEYIPPPLTFSQFPDPACVGDTVLIVVQNNLDSLEWSAVSGLTMIGHTSPTNALVVTQSSTAEIFFEGIDPWSAYCTQNGTYVLQFTSCLNPTASFISSSDTICPGSCVDFTNTSQYATSYQWFFPGATNSTSTNVNPTGICYNTPGTYDVTLIADNTQGSDTLLLTNYIHVQPFPPALSINQSGDTLIAPQIFVTYQWYYNGNVINGATDYFYVAQQNGDYWLTVSDSNGCEVEAVTLNVITSIPSTAEKIISVWPNPAKDELGISGLSQAESTLISIYTLTGQKILSALLVGEKVNSIDIAALEPGFYILESGDADTAARARFIKQ